MIYDEKETTVFMRLNESLRVKDRVLNLWNLKHGRRLMS